MKNLSFLYYINLINLPIELKKNFFLIFIPKKVIFYFLILISYIKFNEIFYYIIFILFFYTKKRGKGKNIF
jgi:hypothetical protein